MTFDEARQGLNYLLSLKIGEEVTCRAEDHEFAKEMLKKLEYAERWCALMGCARMSWTGSVGFGRPRQHHAPDYRHMAISFWSHHETGDSVMSKEHHLRSKELLLEFTDVCIKLEVEKQRAADEG